MDDQNEQELLDAENFSDYLTTLPITPENILIWAKNHSVNMEKSVKDVLFAVLHNACYETIEKWSKKDLVTDLSTAMIYGDSGYKDFDPHGLARVLFNKYLDGFYAETYGTMDQLVSECCYFKI